MGRSANGTDAQGIAIHIAVVAQDSMLTGIPSIVSALSSTATGRSLTGVHREADRGFVGVGRAVVGYISKTV